MGLAKDFVDEACAYSQVSLLISFVNLTYVSVDIFCILPIAS